MKVKKRKHQPSVKRNAEGKQKEKQIDLRCYDQLDRSSRAVWRRVENISVREKADRVFARDWRGVAIGPCARSVFVTRLSVGEQKPSLRVRGASLPSPTYSSYPLVCR